MRWECVYQGRPDNISASGVAQPSWHTFDRRVWKHGEYELELTNLDNAEGLQVVRVPKKITTYQAVIRRGPEVVHRRRGHDWQKLVREMKASV